MRDRRSHLKRGAIGRVLSFEIDPSILEVSAEALGDRAASHLGSKATVWPAFDPGPNYFELST